MRRFGGAIAGVGTASGVRVVVGHWADTPAGTFSDVMVETATGHRLLLAPTDEVAELVGSTYRFDEVRVETVRVETVRVSPVEGGWQVRTPSLSLDLTVGPVTALGRLLALVPRRVAASPAWCTLVDPVARVLLRGVRTRGSAGSGRREYYGALGVRAVTAASGRLDGVDLGALRPVDPPCRFGFSSTPRRPCVTEVVTTIVEGERDAPAGMMGR